MNVILFGAFYLLYRLLLMIWCMLNVYVSIFIYIVQCVLSALWIVPYDMVYLDMYTYILMFYLRYRLGSVQFVTNVAFGRVVLGRRISPRMYAGTAVLIVGIV